MTLPNYIAYFILFGGWSIPAWLIWRIGTGIKRRKKSACKNRRTNHLKIGIIENGFDKLYHTDRMMSNEML